MKIDLQVSEKYVVRKPEDHRDQTNMPPRSIDDLLGYVPIVQLQGDRYVSAAYHFEINPDRPYFAGYPRSDLVNFVLDLNTHLVPFVNAGFFGVTVNMAERSRNTTETRGDRTQELLTDTHELVFHATNKWSDNDLLGFYHIRRMQAAMFPRKSDLRPDPYSREAVYKC